MSVSRDIAAPTEECSVYPPALLLDMLAVMSNITLSEYGSTPEVVGTQGGGDRFSAMNHAMCKALLQG